MCVCADVRFLDGDRLDRAHSVTAAVWVSRSNPHLVRMMQSCGARCQRHTNRPMFHIPAAVTDEICNAPMRTVLLPSPNLLVPRQAFGLC
jgi:hypothetical protein